MGIPVGSDSSTLTLHARAAGKPSGLIPKHKQAPEPSRMADRYTNRQTNRRILMMSCGLFHWSGRE